MVIGKTRWAIPEGYIPEGGTGQEPELKSHEALCVLNAGDEDVDVAITVYFTDRGPAGPFEETVPAERTKHLRFAEFEDPKEIPTGTPFASVLEAGHPVVCQHTRLDSRQAENALLSTIAHPGET